MQHQEEQTTTDPALEIVGEMTLCLKDVCCSAASYACPILINHEADRGPPSMREDLPLPTEPPFTAFVGNLAFDLTEREIEEFFSGNQVRKSSHFSYEHAH